MEFHWEDSRIVFDVHPGVDAWFSTRLGGVSVSPLESLNLSFGVGDDPANVAENRRRILALAGRSLSELVMPRQVHGNHIEWVDQDARGRGALGPGGIDRTDGFLTTETSLVLGMGFADCVPLFMADEAARVVGIFHAGWRGTAAQIQRQAIRQFKAHGIDPGSVLVGIGPAIGPCCYEVDEPVRNAIVAVAGATPLVPKDETHWWLDLALANRIILEKSGVPAEHIVAAPWCTGCRPDLFYSYRIEGPKTGRMGGYICLKSR